MSGVRKLGAASVRMAEQARPMATGERMSAARPDLEDAAAKAEQVAFKQAYLEGFDAGHADGLKDVEKRNDVLRGELETAARDVLAERDKWRGQTKLALERLDATCAEYTACLEPIAVEIAYTAVCKIVGQMQAERTLVAAVCCEILAGLRSRPIEVRVSDADLASLGDLAGSIEVISDSTLEPGDCVVRSNTGEVDGSVRAQLIRLQQVLHAELGMVSAP